LEWLLDYSDIAVGVSGLEGPFWVLLRNWKGRSWSLIIHNIPVVPEFCFIILPWSCSVAMFAMIKETQAKTTRLRSFWTILAYIHNISCLYIKDLQQQNQMWELHNES